MGGLIRNLRLALRSLLRTRGFTAVALLTLALAMGANSAMMSLVSEVLLRALPMPEPDRLVRLQQLQEQPAAIAPARLEDWRRQGTSLQSLGGYFLEDVSNTSGAYAERVRRAVVTSGFFETLGVAPALGRVPLARELEAGAPVVVLGDRYWREQMDAAPDVLGRTLRLDGQPATVVGVMPPTFQFPEREVALWSARALSPEAMLDRKQQWYTGVGRLRAGVTPEQARSELSAIQRNLGERFPESDRDLGVVLEPLAAAQTRGLGASLWLLYGAVCVLLLIACTNISAMLLARAAERAPQAAVRYALGASRRHVAAQFLTETAVLALVAAALALPVAVGACALVRWLAPELPRVEEVGVDASMLLYTGAAALVVTLVCGLLPALRYAREGASISSSGRGQIGSTHRVQWLLVGAQVSLSVALLAGAGLLVRSIERLARVEPGFDPGHVLILRQSGNWSEEADRARLVQRIDGTLEALAALPGVEGTASAWQVPGVPTRYGIEFEPEAGHGAGEPALHAEWRTVSPGYFGVTRIPLLGGETCRGARSEVMVNQRFAQRYFPNRSVLGQGLTWEGRTQSGRIVGVVGDARESGLDREPAPTVYACDSAPSPFPWLLVRTSGEPLAIAAAVRDRLQQLEPMRPVYGVATLEQRIRSSYAPDRLRAALVALFATTALGLSALGIYGTLAYVVSLRRREIGLRIALGARPSDTTWRFVSRVLRVVLPACAIGVVLALAGGQSIAGMLHGVAPWDPLTFVAVIVLVPLVAALAALSPALAAARTEPMQALRDG